MFDIRGGLMLSAVDRSNVVITESVVSRTARSRFVLVTRNHRNIWFQFFNEGTSGAVELAEGSTGQLILKRKGQHAEAPLAIATEWTKDGTGADTIYKFSLSTFGDGLAALFGTGVETVSGLVLELTYIENEETFTPPAVPCTVHKRYLTDNESGPEVTADYPPAANILVKTAQALTDPEKAQVLANLGINAAWFLARLSAADLSTLPTADPGDGKLWRNGNVLQIGAA